MRQIILILTATFLLMTNTAYADFLLKSEKTEIFNDSLNYKFMLMTAKITGDQESTYLFRFKDKQGALITSDFTSIYGMRTYIQTTSEVKLALSFIYDGQVTDTFHVSLPANRKGYVEISVPYQVLNNAQVNNKKIAGIKIKVLSGASSTFLMDEMTFKYFDNEKNPTYKGPVLEGRLKEEYDKYIEEKAKEQNSDFIKKKKRFGSR